MNQSPERLYCFNRITEILSVSLYLTPRGYMVDVLFRHWTLPQAVTSPLPLITVSVVFPQLYHGPIDRYPWFLPIFGPSPQRVSRLTFVLSSGSPHRTGLLPRLTTLDSLPDVVEVHMVVPNIPPGDIGRPFHAPLASPPYDRSFGFPLGARRTVHLHCSSGFSPLHSVLLAPGSFGCLSPS